MFSIAESLPNHISATSRMPINHRTSSQRQLSQNMPQKLKGSKSETSSWISESDQYNIGDEVEWACARLQDAIRDERFACESLESLFRKRREDALDGVRKAQRHLEFVNQEEERLRKAILNERSTAMEAIATSDSRRMGAVLSTAYSPLPSETLQKPDFIDDLPELEPSDGDDSPSLKQCLSHEENSLNHQQDFLKEHERKAKALPHLIARFEGLCLAATGMNPDLARNISPRTGSDESENAGWLIGAERPAHVSGELQGDILLLKEWLKAEEGVVKNYLFDIEATRRKITSYQRRIGKVSPLVYS